MATPPTGSWVGSRGEGGQADNTRDAAITAGAQGNHREARDMDKTIVEKT